MTLQQRRGNRVGSVLVVVGFSGTLVPADRRAPGKWEGAEVDVGNVSGTAKSLSLLRHLACWICSTVSATDDFPSCSGRQ